MADHLIREYGSWLSRRSERVSRKVAVDKCRVKRRRDQIALARSVDIIIGGAVCTRVGNGRSIGVADI